MLEFIDAFLPIGRTNGAVPQSPTCEREALALMDRFGVAEALVYHTVARDSDAELGNQALTEIASPRLHKVWAFDPTFGLAESPPQFLERALAAGARAILVNPLVRGIRLGRSPRLLDLAALLETRRIPLLVAWRSWDSGQDVIDWYELAEFCRRFPGLPVIAWEHRARSNRPMFDALAAAANLKVSLSAIWQAQVTPFVCEQFGADRLVFSLGLPGLDPAAFPAVLAYAEISETDRRAIAADTMRCLLENADHAF